MKVKELIKQLENADGDLEVFASPVITAPLSGKIGADSKLQKVENIMVRMTHPLHRFEVTYAQSAGVFGKFGENQSYFAIGFEYEQRETELKRVPDHGDQES